MRKFRRRPVELPVTVRAAANRVQGGIRLDAADLSEGGAFLRSDLLFEVGERLELDIVLPNSRVVRARGRVVRVSRSGGRQSLPGMGIEFTELAAGDRQTIALGLLSPPKRVR